MQCVILFPGMVMCHMHLGEGIFSTGYPGFDDEGELVPAMGFSRRWWVGPGEWGDRGLIQAEDFDYPPTPR